MGAIKWLIGYFNFLFPLIYLVCLIYYLAITKKYIEDSLCVRADLIKEATELFRQIRDMLKEKKKLIGS